MQFEPVDIRLTIENVFATTLGMVVAPGLGTTTWPPRIARIEIRGSWRGLVVIATSEPVLRATVAAMCGVRPHECTRVDLTDALLELTNLVGGCVKSLLPDDCRLGLPEEVAEPPLPGESNVDRSFRCDGEPIRLWIDGEPCEAAAPLVPGAR